jgi:hypothetical protein
MQGFLQQRYVEKTLYLNSAELPYADMDATVCKCLSAIKLFVFDVCCGDISDITQIYQLVY